MPTHDIRKLMEMGTSGHIDLGDPVYMSGSSVYIGTMRSPRWFWRLLPIPRRWKTRRVLRPEVVSGEDMTTVVGVAVTPTVLNITKEPKREDDEPGL